MSSRQGPGGKMRTNVFSTTYKKNKNTLKEKGLSYHRDVVTTTLYCVCQDCMKYCDYRKPVKCIDPFLVDMKHTYWIYHGLVTASKTERAISITIPEKMKDITEENEEVHATEN